MQNYTQGVQTERNKLMEKYATLVKPYYIKEGETIEQLKIRMSE